jgi:glutamine synthetase
VPVPKKGHVESTRIEYRAPDPACNPYLAFALILAAGLKGVDDGYELTPEAAANLYELSQAELLADKIESLPGSLAEAITEMEGSELVADTLGEHVFEWFIRNKRNEWAGYKEQVSQWELDRYLPSL